MSAKFDDFFTPVSGSLSENEEMDDFFTPIKETSRTRSIISAPIKGFIKGANIQSSLSPMHSVGPIPQKLGERVTEEFLPTQDKPLEGALERGGKIAASFLTGGPAGFLRKAITAGIGGIAGESVKQAGGGEIAQDIAELASMSLPDLAKNIPAKKAQERVIGFLRKKGFSENEITPLIQSPKKLARMAKFASKGEKTNKLMRETYEKFDNVYSSIRESGEKLPGLRGEQADIFLGNFQEKMDKIPKFYKRQIKEEIDDLLNSELKFNDFMDFDQAVNARIKGVEGGKAILGTLKEATSKAKQAVNPQLAEDLKLANELYGKRINVSQHLRTKQLDDLLDMGEAIGTMGAIADQNVGLITKMIGISGARKIAREMLINPRLQNISKRMLASIKNNKFQEASKLYKIFRDEAIKSDKDLEGDLPDY